MRISPTLNQTSPDAMNPRNLTIFLVISSATPAFAEPLQFNRDIRPILSENCFACHGNDPKNREAKLRIDIPEGAPTSTQERAYTSPIWYAPAS